MGSAEAAGAEIVPHLAQGTARRLGLLSRPLS